MRPGREGENVLTRAEIRLAAESIAAQVWEKGGSLDQLQIEIAQAFRRDGERAQEAAQDFAHLWYLRCDHANQP